MQDKVIYANFSDGFIPTQALSRQRRQLEPGLIGEAKEEVPMDVVIEHDSEPIKSLETIKEISDYLVAKKRYRDNMLWIVGINFGLRISDLLQLRFCNLIDEHFCFRQTFPILEKKTRNTRKVARNRYITINDAVIDAVTLYLKYNHCKLDDYMFRSESNRGITENVPLHRNSVYNMLQGIKRDLHIEARMATHTMRKTFGYHQMVMSGNDPRKLMLLQKIFGHSSPTITLDYIGITEEEIAEAYLNLNLGSKKAYQRFNHIGEGATA